MNRDAVTLLVRERASRFGDRDPQQLRRLRERLRSIDPTEATHGLLQVFTTGDPAPLSSAAQELAGHLLPTIEPVALLDLRAIIVATLPRYELSVEELPHFLACAGGASHFSAVLDELESEPLAPAEERALKTMKFWLRNYRPPVKENEA